MLVAKADHDGVFTTCHISSGSSVCVPDELWEYHAPPLGILEPVWAIAHIFKDAVTMRRQEFWPGLKTLCNDMEQYVQLSESLSNVTHDGQGILTATRNIEEGEEILCSLGPLFWTWCWYGREYADLLFRLMKTSLSPVGETIRSVTLERRLSRFLMDDYIRLGMPHIPGFIDTVSRVSELVLEPAVVEEFEVSYRRFKYFVENVMLELHRAKLIASFCDAKI